MRLNKALRNEQICLHSRAVNDQRCAGGQNTDLNIGIRVKGVVDNDFFMAGNFLPQLVFQLRGGSGAVKAGGYQQCDSNIRVAFPQLAQHWRQNIPAGHRAGVVGDNDGAGFLAHCQPGQFF